MNKFFVFLSLSIASLINAAPFVPANRPYDATHYRVKLAIDPATDPKTFTAEAQIKIKASTALSELELDAEQLEVTTVLQTAPVKRKLEHATQKDHLIIKFPKEAAKGSNLAFTITYTGKINDGHKGLFKVTDPDDTSRGPLLFTQFESLGARRFLPCNDEPYDKATMELVVTTPARNQVVSNGKLVSDKKLKDGSHEVHWSQDKPISTYLLVMAVGPFAVLKADSKKPEITVYVGEKKQTQAKFALKSTVDSMSFLEKYLGVKYPWAKYATIGAPTFIWGGMENVSATVMNEDRILMVDPESASDYYRIVGLVSHELAHQWFGDLVTLKWWNDLWLNESFASFMSTRTLKEIYGAELADMGFTQTIWDGYYREEDGPRSHPIVNDNLSGPEDAFDATNYTKGENVLRMLNYYIGDEAFRKGVTAYLNKKAYGNATYLDFFESIEKASGEKLDKFRDSWLLQRGYPVLTYAGTWDSTKSTYNVVLTQKSNHAEDNSLFTFRVPVSFHRRTAPAYDKEISVSISEATTNQAINLPAQPEWMSVNPRGVALVKLVPQQKEESVFSLQATQDPDGVTRSWAALELASGLLEGKSISNAAEATLIDVVSQDRSPHVRNILAFVARRMKTRWFPEALGNRLLELAEQAQDKAFRKTVAFESDPVGWKAVRSSLLSDLGRVKSPKVLPFLATVVTNKSLSYDELAAAAGSIARLGDPKSAEALRAALSLQKGRGYRYEFTVKMAFAAYENPAAANEIREIFKTCGSDYAGRVGWVVADNQPLKNSPEWANFLKEVVLQSTRFDDEVKSRLMKSIEEVKTDHVRDALQTITKETKSDRLREMARKILDKNFASSKV
jgi:aminopeptidase N